MAYVSLAGNILCGPSRACPKVITTAGRRNPIPMGGLNYSSWFQRVARRKALRLQNRSLVHFSSGVAHRGLPERQLGLSSAQYSTGVRALRVAQAAEVEAGTAELNF